MLLFYSFLPLLYAVIDLEVIHCIQIDREMMESGWYRFGV